MAKDIFAPKNTLFERLNNASKMSQNWMSEGNSRVAQVSVVTNEYWEIQNNGDSKRNDWLEAEDAPKQENAKKAENNVDQKSKSV